MSAKITIIKVTADGEQTGVEVNLEKEHYDRLKTRYERQAFPDPLAPNGHKVVEKIIPGESLHQILEPFFQLVDDRLAQQNARIRAANYYQGKLAKLSPEAYMMVNEIWEIQTGRRSGPAVQEVLDAAKAEVEQAKAEATAKQAQLDALQAEVNNKLVGVESNDTKESGDLDTPL